MKVKELIKELKKLPQNEVVYYSDNNEFLDIDAVGHNPKIQDYDGFVILGFDSKKHCQIIKGNGLIRRKKWKLKS